MDQKGFRQKPILSCNTFQPFTLVSTKSHKTHCSLAWFQPSSRVYRPWCIFLPSHRFFKSSCPLFLKFLFSLVAVKSFSFLSEAIHSSTFVPFSSCFSFLVGLNLFDSLIFVVIDFSLRGLNFVWFFNICCYWRVFSFQILDIWSSIMNMSLILGTFYLLSSMQLGSGLLQLQPFKHKKAHDSKSMVIILTSVYSKEIYG